MKTLSKIGWFCAALGILLVGIVFAHYDGLTHASGAIAPMLAAVFWGGLIIAGLFLIIMSILFLRA